MQYLVRIPLKPSFIHSNMDPGYISLFYESLVFILSKLCVIFPVSMTFFWMTRISSLEYGFFSYLCKFSSENDNTPRNTRVKHGSSCSCQFSSSLFKHYSAVQGTVLHVFCYYLADRNNSNRLGGSVDKHFHRQALSIFKRALT